MGGSVRDPWRPYVPDRERPWDRRRVVHLLSRAGLGAAPGDVETSLVRGPDDTIRWLLDVPAAEGGFGDALRRAGRELAPRDEVAALRAGWVHRMLSTPHPLRERMTLFWHDHFATSLDKVLDPKLMADQNETFRRHALGDFRDLLVEISRDPAMIVWLDGQANRKQHPNENYARELLELFALGTGPYTEEDVRETARAFTGWHRRGRAFHLDAGAHDGGVKTILGRTGRWDGLEAIRIVLEHESSARFLAGKLFRTFVHPDPDPELVEPLAGAIRTHRWQMRPVLETILRSNVFHSDWARRSIIKGPVEFVVGTILALEADLAPLALAEAMASMGQNLFYPPDVSGWDGGRAWISASTVLARSDFALEVSRARGGAGGLYDPGRGLPLAEGPEALVGALVDRLFAGDLAEDVAGRLFEFARTSDGGRIPAARWPAVAAEKARGLVHLMVSLPEYNLM